MLDEGHVDHLEEPRPADALDPLAHALPVPGVLLVGAQDLHHHLAGFRPARRVVRQPGHDQLVELRLGARIGVLAANPDGHLGLFLAVDLHRRAGRVAGAAAHALLLVHFQRRLAIDQRRADGRHGAAGDNSRTLADIGHQIMIDARRLGVLHVDGDIALTAAVDLAARGRDAHAVRHLFVDELVIHLIHQRLHDAGSVRAGNVAMQPALGMRNHRHRVAGAAHRETGFLELFDQRFDIGFVGQQEFDVRTRGETHMAIGVLVGEITQLADGEHVHLALCAGAHGVNLVAGLGHMAQNAGTGTVVIIPLAIVLLHHRVHVRKRIRHTMFFRHARLDSGFAHSLPSSSIVLRSARRGLAAPG